MAFISYVAYVVDNPAEQAGFYNRYLKTEEIGRSPEGDISITDGFYNLTFFRKRPELYEPRMEPGLNHLGFEVASIDGTVKRYLRYTPRGVVVPEAGGLQRGQVRIHDPDSNPVTLSEKGFGVSKKRRLPGIRHLVYNTLDIEGMLEFYVQVLELREVTVSQLNRQQGKPGRFLGDGFTNLAILAHYSDSPGHQPKFGLNHIGFVVPKVGKLLDEIKAEVAINERSGSAERPYAEWRFTDPFGNYVDLSEGKAWEVDVGKWEHAA
jgi:catechol 2,3-dioxygenase-like lactoylglutathione lyase family enzyme